MANKSNLTEFDRISELDKWFTRRGPCPVCNVSDDRICMYQVIYGRYKADESIESLALDYGVPIEAIEAVIRLKPWGNPT